MTTSTDIDIEALWAALAVRGDTGHTTLHQRVDAEHPLDFYAGVDAPDRPCLMLISPTRPPAVRPLRAVEVDIGHRSDGRFTLTLSLTLPPLREVFARLCADLVASSRAGVAPGQGPVAVATRLERWRRLMEGEAAGLSRSTLRGLLGELLVLRMELLPAMPALDAVRSWKGPLGAHQDFVRPDGSRIEVKAVHPDQCDVRISSLAQLDGEGDPLTLAVVRLADTTPGAPGTLTAPELVAAIKTELDHEPFARTEFDSLLAAFGWHHHPDHDRVAGRLLRIDWHDVDESFPRVTRSDVPAGVVDAVYTVVLPSAARSLTTPP